MATFLQHGQIGHLFTPNEVEAYEFVHSFVKQFGSIPKEETILAHTQQALVPHKEPAEYYLELMQARYIELQVKKAAKKASDFLLPDNKDPAAALKAMADTVLEVMTQTTNKVVYDFRDAYDLLIPDYVAQYNAETSERLLTGWKTLDDMSGGFVRGDLVSLIGRPKLGKTWFMLYVALHGWRKAQEEFEKTGKPDVLHGSSRLFVSMEMKALPIQQRMAAMYSNVAYDQLKHASLSSKGLKKFKDSLKHAKKAAASFHIIDGNLASSVEEIELYARQLKPGAIFIDGGYLLTHPDERDLYRRVAKNAGLIKERLCPLAPTVVSWQFAKSASKKKKGEKVTYDDIGYTDAIAQLSSVALGIFEEDSVETLVRRAIDILAGRNGEVGRFLTNWDFSEKMDFSEVIEEEVGELQFV